MPRLIYILALLIAFMQFNAQLVTASFVAPDTVCVGQSFTVQNTTTGPANSYYWNFCLGNTNNTPVATNLGNIGALNGPVYWSAAKDGNNYYGFVSNNWGGTLTRLTYGSSLINTPTGVNLGNFGGIIPTSIEDIFLQQESGNWYGIMTGGSGAASRIIRLNFGSSLANIPTAVNMGNIGGLSYPQRIQIFSSGGNIYGFTPNLSGNSITRFSFGTSIANTPTGINLGNIGSLSQPDDIAIINYGGNWYGYVVNEISNSITRLDFGTSLLNTPTGVNLGNTGGLNGPRGIDVWVECGNIKGLIVNRYGNDILNMNFSAGPTGPLTTVSLGNIATFSFPHSIKRFRVGDTLFAMIPNVSNHTLSRIYYPSCVNASIPSSTVLSPPAISYNQAGTYYISLTVNETQINKSDFCKQVVAINPPTVSVSGTTLACVGGSLQLSGTSPPGCSYFWQGPNSFTSSASTILIQNATLQHSGTYSLTVSKGVCSSSLATIAVSVAAPPTVNLGNDTSICSVPFVYNLNAGNSGSIYSWSTGQSGQTITVNSPGSYSVTVTNSSGCTASDAILLSNNNITLNLGNDTVLCNGQNMTLNAGNNGALFQWNTGVTTQTVNISNPGIYSVSVSLAGCVATDSIVVTVPSLSPAPDINICDGQSGIIGTVVPNSTYLWSNGAVTPTLQVSEGGQYSVIINSSGCLLYDSINVTLYPRPYVNLGSDIYVCAEQPVSSTFDAGNSGSAFSWNTGATTQIITASVVGVYQVEVTNSYGCKSADEIAIRRVNFFVDLGNDLTICENNPIVLNAGNSGGDFLWNTGAQTHSIEVATGGMYTVSVSQHGCIETDSVFVNVISSPQVVLGADTVVCPGESIIFTTTYYDDASYIWSNGVTTNTIQVDIPGIYSVKINIGGCEAFDQIKVDDCESEIWIPNSFTPNGDGKNDLFGPVYFNIEKIEMLVFDRWGELIFEGSGKNCFWDGTFKGKPCQDGVYTYKLNYKRKRKAYERIGSVTLLKEGN